MQLHLSEERQAQLNAYAQRHGQEPEAALDEVLAAALAWDQLDYGEALEGIREAHEDMKAGRTQPASEVFGELQGQYGLPR